MQLNNVSWICMPLLDLLRNAHICHQMNLHSVNPGKLILFKFLEYRNGRLFNYYCAYCTYKIVSTNIGQHECNLCFFGDGFRPKTSIIWQIWDFYGWIRMYWYQVRVWCLQANNASLRWMKNVHFQLVDLILMQQIVVLIHPNVKFGWFNPLRFVDRFANENIYINPTMNAISERNYGLAVLDDRFI